MPVWSPDELYRRFQRLSFHDQDLGFSMDLSRLAAEIGDVEQLAEPMGRAFRAMAELENGAIANPDEGRRVGHYWLRAPELAPEPELERTIIEARQDVERFASSVLDGTARPKGGAFERALLIGIGGSALGPQLLVDALGRSPGLPVGFLDNTDPDGIDRVLAGIGDGLSSTLTIVVSKSGGTKETRNGMLEVERAYGRRGLRFGEHAVAITSSGSQLDRHAQEEGFLARFPMWDWVGGRTSATSAVGLLPAALAGVDIGAFLDGARRMDKLTRQPVLADNPAALMAAAWYLSGNGQGAKNLVVIPYKDRLQLFSRYLQQLVMESLGKAEDLDGRPVHQGLTVYGNKGSTDQHAYVQQLLDGPDDFLLTFVEVLVEREGGTRIEVEPGVTSGDYLSGFLHGTRRALTERGRQSLLISIERLDAASLGALIALFERAVGLYASLLHINAYHQPAVESGKRAAAEYLERMKAARAWLAQQGTRGCTAEAVAAGLGTPDIEGVLRVLRHLAANPLTGVRVELPPGAALWEARYRVEG